MPGKDSLEGREQYRKEQIARWKSDEIKRIIAERDALKERVKVVEGVISFMITNWGSRICTNINAAYGCDYRERDCLSSDCRKRIFDKLIVKAEKEGTCES